MAGKGVNLLWSLMLALLVLGTATVLAGTSVMETPQATATATPTPTSTATPEECHLFLPLELKTYRFPGTAGNCATCHAPGAAVNKPFTADMNELSGVETEGVFCDFCHKIGNAYLNPATGLP